MLPWKRILLVAGLVSIVALPGGLIWGGRVLEHSPNFCGSCHEMRPSYNGWMASGAVNGHPDCITCHIGVGLPAVLESEVRGVRMMGLHFFGNRKPGSAIHANVPERFCLRCHEGEKLIASHAMFRTEGRTCSDCHKHRAGWQFKGQVEP
jgi:cytochrome c nitrite reductase small subunit